jgi:hypothetical protein
MAPKSEAKILHPDPAKNSVPITLLILVLQPWVNLEESAYNAKVRRSGDRNTHMYEKSESIIN